MEVFWRKCGSCKKEIGFQSIYQKCSVSSCSKLVFCSIDCWDQHNPVMNHKSSWAEEAISPKREQIENVKTAEGPVRRIVATTSSIKEQTTSSPMEKEILIVASKLKQYIKDKFDMNTSANVMEELSHHVRKLTDQAAENAKRDGRKTIMDRDFL